MSIEIWGKPACPSCMKAKAFCEPHKYPYVYKELGKDFDREQTLKTSRARTPQIVVNKEKIGGYEASVKLY